VKTVEQVGLLVRQWQGAWLVQAGGA
jgi:hypothetical protein